jgi:hypothetical protein
MSGMLEESLSLLSISTSTMDRRNTLYGVQFSELIVLKKRVVSEKCCVMEMKEVDVARRLQQKKASKRVVSSRKSLSKLRFEVFVKL